MIAAIGAFDGFHKGHQALLRVAEKRAGESGTGWGTITFENPPEVLLFSPNFKSLFTTRERLVLEKFFDVQRSIRLPFTKEMSQMSPILFLDFISEKFGICGLVVGEEFRFGKERGGNVGLLARESAERGWVFDAVPLLRDAYSGIISSTAIREAVTRGDMARAWEMQGYPFFFVSRVIHGNERGRALGYPTANLDICREKVSMKYGVYATLVRAMGKWYIGAANVGLNPTFDDIGGMRFEVNLLDFSSDLYGQEIAVFFIEHVRDEMRFDSPCGLVEQMRDDTLIIRDIGRRASDIHAELWEALGKAMT